MSNNYRELTGREKQRIKSWLLLSVPTTTKSTAACHWTVTVQCWVSVLPTAHYADISASLSCRKMQGLEAVFTQTPTTHCKQCGKPFPTDGKRVYCSQRCAEEARRKQTAARVRKYREKQQQM